MLLDLTDNDLVGGHVWQDSTVIYPLYLAVQNDLVHVLSMESSFIDPTTSTKNDGSRDPSRFLDYAQPGGDNFALSIATHTILAPNPDRNNITDVLEEPAMWKQRWAPQDSPLYNIAGLLAVAAKDYVFVAGSTSGDGPGFGTRTNAGVDVDGFFTKFGITATTNDSPTTWRIGSFAGADDYVYGMCASSNENDEYIYVTGSTPGFLQLDQDIGRQTKAFLAKINSADMETAWVTHLVGNDAEAQVEGIACTVATNNDSVYVAGHVQGGHLENSGIFASYGGTDIFVSRVSSNAQVLWTKQFGTANDDTLAHRNGLISLGTHSGNEEQGVVIVGNTQGAMYYKNGEETMLSPGVSTVFAVVMASDGTLTMPMGTSAAPTPDTPVPTTPVPTASPVEAPTQSPGITTATAAPSVAPTEALEPPLPLPPPSNAMKQQYDCTLLLFLSFFTFCASVPW